MLVLSACFFQTNPYSFNMFQLPATLQEISSSPLLLAARRVAAPICGAQHAADAKAALEAMTGCTGHGEFWGALVALVVASSCRKPRTFWIILDDVGCFVVLIHINTLLIFVHNDN